MGTQGCESPSRPPVGSLGRRPTDCHIPETGLRKSCGTATFESGSRSSPQAPPPSTDSSKPDPTKGAAVTSPLLRSSSIVSEETSPGPIYFLDPKVTRFGRSCPPAYSIQGRGKSRGLEVTPGPGAYSPEKVAPPRQRTPPAFTLGSRLRPQPLDTSAPAPNTYTLPSLWGAHIFVKPSSPCYTAAGRPPPLRPAQDPADIPGPGQYESPNPDAYRQRLPAFTMPGRARALRPLMETPGPGTHSPEHVTVTKARAPAFTMGIRHSKRATTMGTDACSLRGISALRPREMGCKALVGLV